MKRIPLKDTERYTLERFRQCKKTERHLAWLKSRKAGVGGSDMSTILGLNSFKTPYELWLEKTGRVEPEDISDKWAIVKGNALENELRKRFRSNHPEMLVTDGTDKQFIAREKPYLRASLDGILQGEDGSFGILEIKTVGNRRAGDWHEPVEIPFEADVEDMAAIDKAAADFWHFVTTDTPPQLTGGDVQKAFPEPTPDIVDESADDYLYNLLARYESAIRMLNDLKATQKELQEQIILRIGSRALRQPPSHLQADDPQGIRRQSRHIPQIRIQIHRRKGAIIMGAIAQQAQGQQLQPLNPRGKLKQLVEHSWPQIARVIGGNLDSEALLQMCISSINRTPALADCTPVSVLSCFMQCAALGLRPSDVDGLGQAYILPYGNKNYANGEKQATFVIGYKGMLKLLENSGIYAQPRAVYEDDNIKLKLDENGVPTIECPDEVNVDADHSEDKLKFVYLSVQLPNGGRYADYMSKRDLLEYREKYAPRNRSHQITGPWAKNFVEMAKKTIIRRSFKYMPVSIEAKKAASVDETTPDYSDVFQPVITDPTDDVTAEVMEADTPEDTEADVKEAE